MSAISKVVSYYKTQPYHLFLMDGFGAIISASLLILITLLRPSFFYFSSITIRILSAVAYIFAIYSISCSLCKPKKWSKFLFLIAISNLIYCGITCLLVVNNLSKLSTLEIIYFFVEILLVTILVYIEFKVAKKAANTKNI